VRLFSRLFERAMGWARHRHAPAYLAGLSFAESSFFPIPPDVMLAPMALANPQRAWRFAAITTLFSLLGGVAGYLLGMLAFDLIEPYLHQFGYWERYQLARGWFDEWGIWVIFIAGFSPIPYKVFTLTSGVVGMAFLPFVLASLVGRGARFYLVAGLMRLGGEKMEARLKQYMDWLGWVVLALLGLAYILLKG